MERERLAEVTEMLLDDERRLARARKVLGSLSWFMRHLKQPISRRANREEGCAGHFFEQRFYSQPLLTAEDVVATMCYVDLNPVRAGVAHRLEDCEHTSLALRLRRGTDAGELLRPLVSGLLDDGEPEPRLGISYGDYTNRAGALLIEHLEGGAASSLRSRVARRAVPESGPHLPCNRSGWRRGDVRRLVGWMSVCLGTPGTPRPPERAHAQTQDSARISYGMGDFLRRVGRIFVCLGGDANSTVTETHILAPAGSQLRSSAVATAGSLVGLAV